MRRISTSLIAYYLSVFQTHKHHIQDTDLGNSCQEIILRSIILVRNLSFSFLILNYFSFLFVKPILFFRQDIQVCGKVGKRLSVQFPYYLSVSGIFVKRLVYRDYGNG
jgi:hypothetical protein